MKNSKLHVACRHNGTCKNLKSKFKVLKSKCSKSLKKVPLYPILILLVILLVIPMLKYTPFPEEGLRSSAMEKSLITVNVPINDGSYAIFKDDTNELVLKKTGTLESFELDPGQYRIEFAEVTGYKTPSSHKFRLESGADVNIDGYYDPDCNCPLLGVRVFPENAKYTIYNADTNEKVASGQGPDFYQLPVGKYRLEFVEMENYEMLKTQTFLMLPRTITTVNAVYGKK